MQPPCGKDCPDRVLGCHSTCEKYIKFREERDKELAIRYKKKMDERMMTPWVKKNVKRNMKK